jgi:hypothetical protein
MILTANSLVFGVAPRLLIECAKSLHSRARPFSLEEFSQALGAPINESRPVFEAMVAAGYFALDGEGKYAPRELFNRLALARVGEGLPRAQADALLAKVLKAAQRINMNAADFRCRVARIAVFGSYLTDKDPIGDLDLAVDVEELRPQSHADAFDRMQLMRAGRAGPTAKAYAALRLRKPELISIHRFDELAELAAKHRLVFPAMKAATYPRP